MPQTTKHVDFTRAYVDMCQCPSCPVETASACATQAVREVDSTKELPPDPAKAPVVYCSHGTASCADDMDFSKTCICPSCEVWAENGLSNYKYCKNGSAEVQG